ncbi:MAG: PQQ-dependent sugar dehydrogenase, partial [Pseudohongiellaceae bacterium]
QNLPLGDGPWRYRTGEDMNIEVELVTRLEYGMGMVFLPDASLLVATRSGKLYRIADGVRSEVGGGPAAVFVGESGGIGSVHGYMDLALHPDFAANNLVYLSWTRPDQDQPAGISSVGRARLNGAMLEDFELVYDTVDLNGSVSLVFGGDGKLYVTTPDRDSQSLLSRGGKVLRLNDDGSIPADNPFSGRADALPEIYSYGHRFSLGLTTHPGTGQVWQSENGPNGGDEINLIESGANYGWPEVSYGRSYSGPWEAGSPTHAGYALPLVVWIPSVAVAGLTFYMGDALSKWKGDLFVGGLREGEVNGTGHLERILFNRNMEELRRESLLTDLHKRIRDVVQGPDGYLYLSLEDRDGGVLRIKPAP